MEQAYDASTCQAVRDGKTITGFGEGTFITGQKTNAKISAKTNAHGEVFWATSNDKMGQIVITLMQDSPWVATLNKENGKIAPLWVTRAGERFGGNLAACEKIADITLSNSVEARQFTFLVGDYAVING